MSRFREATGSADPLATLSRARNTSSPRPDEYATASSFELHNEPHSTVQWENTYNVPEPSDNGDSNDDASISSIEMGRGVKRDARNVAEEMSPNAIFSLGNDSQYEITGTPPARPRASSKKSDGTLRKEASIRRATETAQRSTIGPKHRTLSEAFSRIHEGPDSSFVEQDRHDAVAMNNRNTRFRSTSANDVPARFTSRQGLDNQHKQTPPRTARYNATVQSANHTGNHTLASFALPDLPNLTELVSGEYKTGTPVFSRSGKARSRFTSGSYRPAPGINKPEHAHVESIPLPQDEKAIIASLTLLKDKVAQLEMDNSEAQKRAEEYEGKIIELKGQVHIEQRLRRPDSALDSDPESGQQGKLRMENTKLQASVKTLQDRLDRSERKVSVSDIAVQRVTKERDALVTQIGVAYYNNEELKAENAELHEERSKIMAENEDTKEELAELTEENGHLRIQIARIQAQYSDVTAQYTKREAQMTDRIKMREEKFREMKDVTRGIWDTQKGVSAVNEPVAKSKNEKRASLLTPGPHENDTRSSSGRVEQQTSKDISDRIEEEVRRCRAEAVTAKSKQMQNGRESVQQNANSRSGSKSQQQQPLAEMERRFATSRRAASAPIESDASEVESTTNLSMTQKTRQTLQNMHLPSPKTQPEIGDDRDITYLSVLDGDVIANLRKKLEEERVARKQKRTSSAPLLRERETTARSIGIERRLSVPRKSSLKDLTAALDDGTGRFSIHPDDEGTKAAKAVRIQSPHTSDASLRPTQQEQQAHVEGETSMISNTSRRRRRVPSMEGMTSAFIIPDITLHSSEALPATNAVASIQHNKADCTACPSGKHDVMIPTAVPVTDRPAPLDVTDATIRPAQPPSLALATVLKQLEDEITHLKLQLQFNENLYNRHDPALSKSKRTTIKKRIDDLHNEVEKRSDQVYALYDVLEGQKESIKDGRQVERGEEGIEETLMSIGLDAREIEQMRTAPTGFDGAMSEDESEELPWEGMSDLSIGEGLEEKISRRKGVAA